MCKIALVLLFSLLTGNNFAQDYFVLIQSDNRQPFYVRLGGQLYPSSPEGHLILSQLKDSTYTVTIGFSGHGETAASEKGREQTYTFGTSHKDQELIIKDQEGAGWGLYDLQAKEWLTVLSRSGGREEVRALGVRKDDAFSRMMAGVVQDTAVLYNNYTVANLAVADTPAAKPADALVAKPADPLVAKPADSAAMVSTSKPVPDTVLAAMVPIKPADTPTAAVIPITDSTLTANTSLYRKPADTLGSATTTKPVADTTLAIASQPANPPAQPAASAIPPAATPVTDTPLYRKPATDSPVVSNPTPASTSPTNPDSATTAAPLYRPIPGTAQHRAAPAVDSPMRQPLYRPIPDVVKLSERKLTHSVRQVYADKGKGAKADTVEVIIPVDTPAAAVSRNHGPNPDSPALSQGNTAAVHVIVPTPVTAAEKSRNPDSAQKKPAKSPLPYVNSDCHNFATDYDVDKLRVKMLEGAKDEDRIAAAGKAFKTKCFFTRQLRALSEVFTTDAAKFRFFEAAWPFAADEHFRELGSLLADPVYANKFKTLTGGR